MFRKTSDKIFQSKLLLFGEQIINKGAMGLAIPLERYTGTFQYGSLRDRAVRESNKSLESLANFIIYTPAIADLYDTNQFLDDLEKGLYFQSDIPQGYGVGSSGALVAAVYHQYRKFKTKRQTLAEVKHDLATLEGHYHGKSSGLDAIVCYLNKAVLVNNGEITDSFDMPESKNAYVKLFLINTHIERKTGDYVNLFLEKCKDKKFMTTVTKSWIPASNIAVESFLKVRYADLWKSVRIISQLQADLIPEFIPRKFHEVWQKGLQTDQFNLKICGAGGGGFIIGFAKAEADLGMLAPGMDIVEVMKF